MKDAYKILGILALFSGLLAGFFVLSEPSIENYFEYFIFFLTLFYIFGISNCVTVYESNRKFLKFFAAYTIIFVFLYFHIPQECGSWIGCIIDRDVIAFTGLSTSSLILASKILANLLSRKIVKNDAGNLISVKQLINERQKFLFIKILFALCLIVWFFIVD